MASADPQPAGGLAPSTPTPVEAVSESVLLEEAFGEFSNAIKSAAAIITRIIGPSVTFPPSLKARYECLTKLEEAHMWAGNGVQALVSKEAEAAAKQGA